MNPASGEPREKKMTLYEMVGEKIFDEVETKYDNNEFETKIIEEEKKKKRIAKIKKVVEESKSTDQKFCEYLERAFVLWNNYSIECKTKKLGKYRAKISYSDARFGVEQTLTVWEKTGFLKRIKLLKFEVDFDSNSNYIRYLNEERIDSLIDFIYELTSKVTAYNNKRENVLDDFLEKVKVLNDIDNELK